VNTIPFYLKLSANGEMEWYKQWVNDTIISNGQQVGDAIATLDGDFVVSALNITYKIRSKDGAVLWGTKKIVDNMVELPDGSLILNSGLYLSKLTSDGKIIWKNRKYWEVDELNSRVGHNRVYVAPDGGILLGGDIRPEINPLLIKLDCEGNSVNTITCQRPVVSQMVEPLEEILVFPNPSSEWLYISLPPDISSPFSFVLYNALGQVVRHIEFEQGQKEQKVDIRGLAQGVYFYQCTSHFHPISKGKLLLTKTD
jgi:hypothetical protein